MRTLPFFLVSIVVLAWSAPGAVAQQAGEEAGEIVRAAWEHWRGVSSYGEMTMTIHRPSWERSMSMRIWTRGQKHSLVRVTAPKKDAGNGTLIVDTSMWTYSPKVNRVIKVPSSMMAQSWMGSDFSNKDVSRSDDVVESYDHSLLGEEEHEGHKVWVIQSIPHEDAAVVWGKELLRIRDDNVLVGEEFYDQEGTLVKSLQTLEVAVMGGRATATRQRMVKPDAPDEWTEITVGVMEYDRDLPDSLFTQSNLRNPRE